MRNRCLHTPAFRTAESPHPEPGVGRPGQVFLEDHCRVGHRSRGVLQADPTVAVAHRLANPAARPRGFGDHDPGGICRHGRTRETPSRAGVGPLPGQAAVVTF